MKRNSKPLLKNRFSKPGQNLFFARAGLYEDRIELSGWSLCGRYEETIALGDIRSIAWWANADPGHVNLCLHMQDGSQRGLHVKGVGLWKFKIEELALNLKKTSSREKRTSSPNSIAPAA